MTTYQVWIAQYKNKGKTGVDTFDNIKPVAQVGIAIQSLPKARAVAYKALSHNGSFNDKGRAVIYANKGGMPVLVGEVHNTVYDMRYWYPSNDGVYCAGGKYQLYESGKIGTRLR